MNINPKIDRYFSKTVRWQEEMKQLRRILLQCRLTEELKWGKPCYRFQEGNVILIFGLKEYCALGFLKGALLNDPKGILVSPGENSQAMRQIRFTHVREIVAMEPVLKAYIKKAIEVEKAGFEIDFKGSRDLVFSGEFQSKLNEIPALKTAFEALTPGRQRAYNLYFFGAKQSKTREARVEKCMPQILKGKGLND